MRSPSREPFPVLPSGNLYRIAAATTPRLPRDARRQTVLDAAGPEFGARGYAAARVGDIATATGVTKPIVYRHFESKKGLYLALLDRHEEDLSSFTEDASGAAVQVPVELILEGWLEYVRSHSFQWLMLFRDPSGDEEIRAARARVSRSARAVMAAFVTARAPHVPADEVEPTAEVVVSGLAGLALWWIDNPATPKETVVTVAVRLCEPALAHGARP